jgi:hypothetical protein
VEGLHVIIDLEGAGEEVVAGRAVAFAVVEDVVGLVENKTTFAGIENKQNLQQFNKKVLGESHLINVHSYVCGEWS